MRTAIALAGATLLAGCKPGSKPEAALPSPAPLAEGCVIANGTCAGVIILPEAPTPMEQEAAAQLSRYLEKATGIAIPTLRENQRPPDDPRPTISIGQTAALRAQGIEAGRLPMETYGLWRKGNVLFLFGKDEAVSRPWMRDVGAKHWSLYRVPATRWAVNTYAEEVLKVRWLWPGPLGTYIPRATSGVFLPPEGKRLLQPRLQRRTYMAKWRLVDIPEKAGFFLLPLAEQRHLGQEGREWLENQMAGNRSELFFGHSFSGWWAKYGKTRPDLFAEPPAGLHVRQPFPNESRVKLRLANPAVLDTIEAEYRAAGMPASWPISPNDGSGFDTSDATMAWDNPPKQNKIAIWKAQGNLTARYVHFWNAVYERLSALNPEVTLSVMAYSAYREPPAPGSVKGRLSLALVNNYKGEEAYDGWRRWSREAREMMLRPNWWHVGVHAPYLEPLAQGEYLRFAGEHGLNGFTIDALLGYWGTQGLNYYVVARMMADPTRDPARLLQEYCEAFGPAAEAVKAYFAYWMAESAAIDFAGAVSIHSAARAGATPGEYEQAARQGGFANSLLLGSFRAIPLLYNDARIGQGERLLEVARARAASDPEALQRVDFLVAGLREFRATRDLLALGYAIKEQKALDRLPEFRRQEAALRALRREMTRRHVLWGESVYENEIRRGVPTTTEALGLPAENMDGL